MRVLVVNKWFPLAPLPVKLLANVDTKFRERRNIRQLLTGSIPSKSPMAALAAIGNSRNSEPTKRGRNIAKGCGRK